MIEQDVTLHLYDDEEPSFVTVEEMQTLLRKQQAKKQEADDALIECELNWDEENQSYDSFYFCGYEYELLPVHLLAEQCFEHFDEVNWESLTNGYDERIIRTINHAIHHPLVWFHIRPDNGSVLVGGRMAVEEYSEERSEEKPYCDFLQTMHNKRLLWFGDKLPTSNDLIVPDATINMQENIPLWYMLTTDFSEYAYTPLVPLWVKNNEEGTTQKNKLFSPKALQQNLKYIAKIRSGARAAFLVKKLREDWKIINSLQLFDVDQLTKEEKDSFDECLNDGLNYYLEQWEKESETANASPINRRPERFKNDPDSSFFIITDYITYEDCREVLLKVLHEARSKADACRNLYKHEKYFALEQLHDDQIANLINDWMKYANNPILQSTFKANDVSKARNSCH